MPKGYSSRGEYFSFNVDWSEIDKAFKELPKTYGKSALKKALQEGAKPIREEAMKNAPIGPTGNLAKSFEISPKLKNRRIKSGAGVYMFVGSTAPHAHLVEFGTTNRYAWNKPKKRWRNKAIDHAPKYVGKMPSNPFFTKAWDSTKLVAFKIIQNEMWVQLVKKSRTIARKAAKGTLSKSAIRFFEG